MNKTNKEKIINNLRKYAPFGGILVLTVFLMFIFKYNKSGVNKLLDEGKSEIENLYAENLKPLFTKTDLTNNDVFDFAVNQKLPIDKDQKEYLKLSEMPEGDKTFEIKKEADTEGDKSYDAYVDALALNNDQKAELDSILGSYKEDLYVSVLYNDDNTIAVNPNLALLQEALQQDLYNYSKAIVSSVEKIAPTAFSIEGIGINFKNVIESYRNTDETNFIFFTPDTVFNSDCEIDKKQMLRDLDKHQWKIENKDVKTGVRVRLERSGGERKESRRNLSESMRVQRGDNDVKVVIPKNTFAQIIVKELPEIQNDLEEFKELNINFDSGKLKNLIEVSIAAAAAEAANVEVNIGEIEKAIDLGDFSFDLKDAQKWEEFGEKMDSLSEIWQNKLGEKENKIKKSKKIEKQSKISKSAGYPKDSTGTK